MAEIIIKFGPQTTTEAAAQAVTVTTPTGTTQATVTTPDITAFTDIRSAFQAKVDNIVNATEFNQNPDGTWRERRATISDNNRSSRKSCKDIESERKSAINTINEIAAKGKKDVKYNCSSANRVTRSLRLLG